MERLAIGGVERGSASTETHTEDVALNACIW
jgi:hypothetical protein